MSVAVESGSAVLSADQRYRYVLRRSLPRSMFRDRLDSVLFVMLNPSIADATEDDPTIRRCLGFTKDLGAHELIVANLYAQRSTDPSRLGDVEDPVGPENDATIVRLAKEASLVVAAWGNSWQPDRFRSERVLELLGEDAGRIVWCFGRCASGAPRHPLYLPRSAKLEIYR